jgi:hypothetical protein
MDSVVLLLNSDYEPLNVCNLRRAFRLVFGEKAEVIQYDHTEVRTATQVFHAPSVIRLHHRIKRPRPRVRLSRREVFIRDKHTCQYCGTTGHDLTRMPYVLAGGGGGKLNTGRVVDYKSAPKDNNQLLVSLANIMGATDITSFGDPSGATGPLPDLTL